MGIFSLFGKKESDQLKSADKDASRSTRSSTSNRSNELKNRERLQAAQRDAQVARATALKIDAIESEMSTEFVNTATTQIGPATQGRNSRTPAPSKSLSAPSPASASAIPSDKRTSNTASAAVSPPTLQPLAPGIGSTTDFLLHGSSTVGDVATPSSEAAAVIEESAIMYANGQNELVEQMLRAAINEDALGEVTRSAWWMLFDLLQLTGKQTEFEQLAIEYANKFEASPPGWIEGDHTAVAAAAPAAGTTPSVSFSGKLDSNAAKHVERIKKLAETHRSLRLEFARVSEVDATGCGLLLSILNALQKSGHNLILVGAPELTKKIREIIQTGRRDDHENCWLLLMEVLRLLNRETEFEETSIDYCVTFEVSPPAFVPPQASVMTAAVDTAPPAAEGFPMPALVEGRIDNLILAITAYSDDQCPAIIDCSKLERVDFNAAGRLLTGLAPFCGNGRIIEFHNVNHLVAELFNVIGLKDIIRILPRKS